MMWEAETGRQYRMTKAHDMYSGLGAAQVRGTDGAVLPTISENTDEEGGAINCACEADSDACDESKLFATTPSERVRVRADQRKREEQIAKEIARAEAIVATFEGIKVLLRFFCRPSQLIAVLSDIPSAW